MVSRFELHWHGGAFFDYVIDGRSMFDEYDVGAEHGQVGSLGWLSARADAAAAARLLLEAPPDLGPWTSIYVCATCGDIDCGATAVVVELDGAEVVWRDPAAVNRHGSVDPGEPTWPEYPGAPDSDRYAIAVGREGYERWPAELRFDAAEYRRAIAERGQR